MRSNSLIQTHFDLLIQLINVNSFGRRWKEHRISFLYTQISDLDRNINDRVNIVLDFIGTIRHEHRTLRTKQVGYIISIVRFFFFIRWGCMFDVFRASPFSFFSSSCKYYTHIRICVFSQASSRYYLLKNVFVMLLNWKKTKSNIYRNTCDNILQFRKLNYHSHQQIILYLIIRKSLQVRTIMFESKLETRDR